MSFLLLLRKRAKAQLQTLAAITLLSVLTGFMIVGSTAYLSAATSQGVEQLFQSIPPAAKVHQYQTRVNSGAQQEQEKSADALFDRFLPSGTFTAHYQIRSNALTVQLPEATEGKLRTVATPDHFPDQRASLLTGSWPLAHAVTPEIALPHDFTELLGVTVGDELDVVLSSTQTVRTLVVGLYEKHDDGSGYWAVSEGVQITAEEQLYAPLVFAQEDFTDLMPSPAFRMNLVANPGNFSSENLNTGHYPFATILEELRADAAISQLRGVVGSGLVLSTLSDLQASLEAVQAVVPVAIILIAVLATISLSQLSQLLNNSRRVENNLFRSRGASTGKIAWMNFIEALLAALPAALLGAFAAHFGVVLLTGKHASLLTAVLLGIAIGIAAALTLVATSLPELRRPLNRETVNETGRSAPLKQLGLFGLVALPTAVALWQFKLHGSALVSSEGVVRVDPVALLAPILLMLTLSVLALLLVYPLSALFSRAARSSGIVVSLSTVQVARRLPVFSVAFTLMSIATASIVFAAGYSGTWSQQHQQNSNFFTPTGTVLSVPIGVFSTQPQYRGVLDFEGEEAFQGAGAFTSIEGTSGSTPVSLLAAPVNYTELFELENFSAAEDINAYLRAHQPRTLTLPQGATTLNIEALSSYSSYRYEQISEGFFYGNFWISEPGFKAHLQDPMGSAISARVVLQDSRGGLLITETEVLPPALSHHLELTLPENPEPWRLVSVTILHQVRSDIQTHADDAPELPIHQQGMGDGEYASEILSVKAGDAELLPTGLFEPQRAVRVDGQYILEQHFTVPETLSRYPAIVNQSLADELNLSLGTEIDYRATAGGLNLPISVVQIVPDLPGSRGEHQLLLPAEQVQAQSLVQGRSMLTPNSFWLKLSDTAAETPSWITDFLIENLGSSLSSSAQVNPLIYASVSAMWLGAGGVMLLSITALIAVNSVLLTTRRSEIPVLRALGLKASQQRRNRVIELILIAIPAVIFGALSGLLTVYLTAPEMARSTFDSFAPSIEMTPSFDLLAALGLGAVLVLAIIAVIAQYGQRVRSQALDTEYREETR